MSLAELTPWNLIDAEIAFLMFAVLVAVGLVFVFAVNALGVPFWRLSETLHPRHQDALRRGQVKRARRLEMAQNVLDKTGDLVVGLAFVGLLAAAVVALWNVLFLAVGVGALLVLALLGTIAERLGLIDPA